MKGPFNLYTGEQGNFLPDFDVEKNITDPKTYRPSKRVKSAVNVAITLGKPLLITGEPGTGKTQLAYSISFDFNLGTPLVFNTRTTSSATDLFYRYDALKHLQYVHSQNSAPLSNDEIEEKFITYQAMGEAIISGERKVVLIDEIDKAPRDLPNDILNIIEEMSFKVPEIDKQFTSPEAKRPIVIFTSNSEKNLPDAFLRRCVYHHLDFPAEKELLDIVSAKFSSNKFSRSELSSYVIPYFLKVRKNLKRKKPSTAELIYWVSLLEKLEFHPTKLGKVDKLSPEDKDKLRITHTVLAKTEDDVKMLEEILTIK